MGWSIGFFIDSILLGVGLAMDAFSVSLANGLHEPRMRLTKTLTIAGVFAGFQFVMPMIGWVCVSTVANQFAAFAACVPWIAFLLLSYIGGKMLYDGIKGGDVEAPAVTIGALLIQGVATSIDALSVGFTVADYDAIHALVACTLIGVVTMVICVAGLVIGKHAGTHLCSKAGILGGIILIAIGLRIIISHYC